MVRENGVAPFMKFSPCSIYWGLLKKGFSIYRIEMRKREEGKESNILKVVFT